MFRVHNADYYMQEAKKLKHKADALVGFLPLKHCSKALYTERKQSRKFTNEVKNPYLLYDALLP